MRKTITKLLFGVCMFVTAIVNAQWTSDPSQNTLIPNATQNNFNTRLVSDNIGGAIIFNRVKTSESTSDLVAQKINANGTVQWQTNGVLICSSTVSFPSTVISDGLGGAIISWIDNRNSGYSIYVQKIDTNGAVVWENNGVLVASNASTNPDSSTTIISDGNEGAIACWADVIPVAGNRRVYLQRISNTGALLWNSSGLAVANTPFQVAPQMTTDNANGAIVAWSDIRSGTGFNLYAQRFDSNGNPLWTIDGITIENLNHQYNRLYLLPDTSNGAVFCWSEERNGTDSDLFAQHVTGSGNILWEANGVSVYSGIGNQDLGYHDTCFYDASGSTYIAFNNYQTSQSSTRLFLQRLDDNGNASWGQGGIPCTSLSEQYQGDNAKIISDGTGGLITCWQGNLGFSGSDTNLFAQRFDSSGNRLWGNNDVAISTAPNSQDYHVMISNGNGGAIMGWNDSRNDAIPSSGINVIYVQNICANGQLGGDCALSIAENTFNQFTIAPNPTNAILNFQLANNQVVDKIVVVDLTGKKLIEEMVNGNQVNVQDLAAGVYVIEVYSNGQQYANKFVKL